MTTFGFDAPIAFMADMANYDGKIRTSNYENHMDMTAILEQMNRKMRFKTGELVNDEEPESENG